MQILLMTAAPSAPSRADSSGLMFTRFVEPLPLADRNTLVQQFRDRGDWSISPWVKAVSSGWKFAKVVQPVSVGRRCCSAKSESVRKPGSAGARARLRGW